MDKRHDDAIIHQNLDIIFIHFLYGKRVKPCFFTASHPLRFEVIVSRKNKSTLEDGLKLTNKYMQTSISSSAIFISRVKFDMLSMRAVYGRTEVTQQ